MEGLAARLSLYIAAACLAGLVMIVGVGTLSRWILDLPIRGSEELARYLLVAITYTGLSWSLSSGGFIGMTLLSSHFRGWMQFAAQAVITIIGLFYTTIFLWQLLATTLASYEGGVRSIGPWEMPIFVPQSAMVIGMGLLTVQLIARLGHIFAQGLSKRPVEAEAIPDAQVSGI